MVQIYEHTVYRKSTAFHQIYCTALHNIDVISGISIVFPERERFGTRGSDRPDSSVQEQGASSQG